MSFEQDISVQCPFCGEWQSLELDLQEQGVMVRDCDVCCRPWRISVQRDIDGEAVVDVQRD